MIKRNSSLISSPGRNLTQSELIDHILSLIPAIRYGYYPHKDERTISSGIITISGGGSYPVDTEGDGATDNLDTINGASRGATIIIEAAHTDRSVVIKHGTGNIYLRAASDITLDNTEKAVMLYYNGSNWVDL